MKADRELILVVNGGSSSIKFAVFEAALAPRTVVTGAIESIGLSNAIFRVHALSVEKSFDKSVIAQTYIEATNLLLAWIQKNEACRKITAIGHRVVHGGSKYSKPVLLTTRVIDELKKVTSIDREHMPNEILLMTSLMHLFPSLKQVACFDTEFHQLMPLVARLLPIPRRYETLGIRRYGFHGLSYEFLLDELGRTCGLEASKSRIVFAHIGSGVSLAAVRDGKCIDTSMSFTPNSGVPMATRSGDLDPGLAPYLALAEGLSPKDFNEMVNFNSGLFGMSEVTSDMRVLLEREAYDSRSADAVAVFCYRIKKCIGEFASALGGIDTLVFSGGIGERAPTIRAKICEDLQFLGIEIDPDKNTRNELLVSLPDGRVSVHVIHTDEELMIAKKVWQIAFANEQEHSLAVKE